MPNIDIQRDALNDVLMLPVEKEDIKILYEMINFYEKQKNVKLERLKIRVKYLLDCLKQYKKNRKIKNGTNKTCLVGRVYF